MQFDDKNVYVRQNYFMDQMKPVMESCGPDGESVTVVLPGRISATESVSVNHGIFPQKKGSFCSLNVDFFLKKKGFFL